MEKSLSIYILKKKENAAAPTATHHIHRERERLGKAEELECGRSAGVGTNLKQPFRITRRASRNCPPINTMGVGSLEH